LGAQQNKRDSLKRGKAQTWAKFARGLWDSRHGKSGQPKFYLMPSDSLGKFPSIVFDENQGGFRGILVLRLRQSKSKDVALIPSKAKAISDPS